MSSQTKTRTRCRGFAWSTLTNFNTFLAADVNESLPGNLGVVAAVLGDLAGGVLVLADGRQVGRVLVGVYSAEEAAWRGGGAGKGGQSGRESEDDGAGVHIDWCLLGGLCLCCWNRDPKATNGDGIIRLGTDGCLETRVVMKRSLVVGR